MYEKNFVISHILRTFACNMPKISMKRSLRTKILLLIVTFLMPLFVCAQNDSVRNYTRQQPLIYEDADDLYPYVFLENGEPKGYNVELISMLLDRLEIPYRIQLKPRRSVLNDMRERKADLTLGMRAFFHNEFGQYGKTIVSLFTHSLVSPLNTPVAVHSYKDLKDQKVIVHRNSFSHHLMMDNGWGDNAIPYDDMEEAVIEASEEGKQVLWNTASLKWIISMHHINNMKITPIDAPHGEYRFISKDVQLLNELDSVFIEVNSTGMLEDMQRRWFHPDLYETGIPSWIWWLTASIALAVIVLIYYNIRYRTKKTHMVGHAQKIKKRLALILRTSHVQIWTYDLTTLMFTWMDKNGDPEGHFTVLEFARRYRSEDFRRIGESIRQLAAGNIKEARFDVRGTENESGLEEEQQERIFDIVLTVLEYENGQPQVIIGTKIDVTEERHRQDEVKQQMMRYQSVFETSMVDMVYYDADSVVTEMNQRACNTFGLTLEELHKSNITLEKSINEDCVKFKDLDYFYATCFFDMNSSDFVTHSNIKSDDTFCYEMQIVPIRTKDNQLLGAYGTGRDVTEVVHTYRKLREGYARLQKASKDVNDYISNINYVLSVSGVRMAEYSPNTHMLTIYRAHNDIQLQLTQTRCMTLIDDKSKKSALRLLTSMDNHSTATINTQLKTTLVIHGKPLYLQIRLVPLRDSEGSVTSYFGICRDVSEIRNTQKQLEAETARAQELEVLQNSFLHNMSYQIRTPLTSVVGFAELFELEHAAEDEPIFIEEIKQNSAFLLRLINDILFLSRLDAHMIEINKQPTDFAKTFEGHCHIGWNNEKNPDVKYTVENPYERLVVDIDDTNMGRIIEQVVANATHHTQHGTVRARYDYIGGKLMITIDDTGSGMSSYMLEHIYERFASANNGGTGLGLPICKLLAEQMGGTIEISSEEGKGTTVWITMPCTATEIDRKLQI